MSQCLHPILVKKWIEDADGNKKRVNDYMFVPCGKCVACLSARRSAWTYRLVQEQDASVLSYFVGLTYDDDHIPIKNCGNIFYTGFEKKHCQLFIKRLREKLRRFEPNSHLSYLVISEYGSKTFRPHYHALLFIKGVTVDSDKYIMRFIEESWDCSSNIPSIAYCSEAAIHYCTKYSLKDVSGSLGYTDYIHVKSGDICYSAKAGTYLERPFMLCSTRPYLGINTEDRIEKHGNFNGVNEVCVHFNGTKLPMPRIYRKKCGIVGSPQDCSVDPRLSKQKYDELMNKFYSDNLNASHEDFIEYLESYFKNKEQRLLDVARRKNEKL